jgi:hypothetical protein
MEQAMDRVFPAEQMVPGLQVGHALRETKERKTEMFRDGRLKRRTRPEMKRREWHGLWNSMNSPPDRGALEPRNFLEATNQV